MNNAAVLLVNWQNIMWATYFYVRAQLTDKLCRVQFYFTTIHYFDIINKVEEKSAKLMQTMVLYTYSYLLNHKHSVQFHIHSDNYRQDVGHSVSCFLF